MTNVAEDRVANMATGEVDGGRGYFAGQCPKRPCG